MMNRLHFQNDILNGWEEDGEPNPERKYEPHALEIPNIKQTKEIVSEKTIFLDPTKYKFNEKTKAELSKLEKAIYWLFMG